MQAFFPKTKKMKLIFLCFHDLFICSPNHQPHPRNTVFHLTDSFSPLLDFIPQSQQSDKIPLPTVHNNV